MLNCVLNAVSSGLLVLAGMPAKARQKDSGAKTEALRPRDPGGASQLSRRAGRGERVAAAVVVNAGMSLALKSPHLPTNPT
ncbi:MAG: hypothetical protein ACOYM3_17660 [Terrimicrobiaceae bacterium]